jgi:hypothetical protein
MSVQVTGSQKPVLEIFKMNEDVTMEVFMDTTKITGIHSVKLTT